MKFLSLVFIVLIGAASPVAGQDLGREIFEKLRRGVFQVKTTVPEESSKQSYGTGFALAGLLITNYHVVAAAVHNPDRYKLAAVVGARDVPARLIGLDVVHDLALLRVDVPLPESVAVAAKAPRQGEGIFSIGLPEDLNLSIIPGTYNGTITTGPYAKIHLAAALNRGMSGGPTVNGRGELIGVNVARHASGQNISFAVPADFVAELLKRYGTSDELSRDEAVRTIERQLVGVQEELSRDYLLQPIGVPAGAIWSLPATAPYLSCWHEQTAREQPLLLWHVRSCALDHQAFIGDDEYFGTYTVQLSLLRNRGLNSRSFYSAQQAAYGRLELNNDTARLPKYTPYRCVEERVTNGKGVPLQIAFCAERSIDYPSLFDARLNLITLRRGDDTLVLNASFSGFTMPNLRAIVRHTVETIGVEHVSD